MLGEKRTFEYSLVGTPVTPGIVFRNLDLGTWMGGAQYKPAASEVDLAPGGGLLMESYTGADTKYVFIGPRAGFAGAESRSSHNDTNVKEIICLRTMQETSDATRFKERNKAYMNPSINLCEPERRDLKRPEVPEILLKVGEWDLLF